MQDSPAKEPAMTHATASGTGHDRHLNGHADVARESSPDAATLGFLKAEPIPGYRMEVVEEDGGLAINSESERYRLFRREPAFGEQYADHLPAGTPILFREVSAADRPTGRWFVRQLTAAHGWATVAEATVPDLR